MEVLLFLYVFLVIVATAAAALLYGNVPYFPIEISRLAASGHWASHIFKWGLAVIPILFFVFPISSGDPVLVFIFLNLQLVTFWNDVDHWFIHMLGVVGMGISATVHVLLTWTPEKAFILLIAIVIWMVRLILKATMVVLYEAPEKYTPYSVGKRSVSIMYTGKCNNPYTLQVFKLCGVLQWIVFALIMTVI